MNARYKILEVAYNLVSVNGLNAFSYKDISNMIGIKTSSIHYHFPTKSDLVLALINQSLLKQDEIMSGWNDISPIERLENFFNFYLNLAKEQKMCIIIAISSDIHGLDDKIKLGLGKFYDYLTDWLASVLEEGSSRGLLSYDGTTEKKAGQILNSAAMIPVLSRIGKDFSEILEIKNSLLNNLANVN